MASSWWTLLLFKKNKVEYEVKKELSLLSSDYSVAKAENEYRRQRLMIFSEGIFLGGTLIAGIWLIYRGNRKELDSINRQNNFLLAITHELKSPLSSIDLIFQTIKKRKLNREQIEDLSVAGQEEVIRLENMIQNLLLSSNDQKTDKLSFSTVAVNDIIFDLLLEFNKLYPSSEITYHCLSGEAIRVKADKNLLKIALKNIIDNAKKYGGDNKIEIELSKFSSYCQITIGDFGSGITDRNKKVIFDRFFRPGNELTRNSKGTGLGLYISKKIIKSHSGTINVKDNHPSGAIFVIDLPIDEA